MKKLLIFITALIMCNAYGEGVYWMVDNAISSVSGCETNGNITTPAIPQKDGYRFIGWEVGNTNSFIARYVTNNGSSYYPTTLSDSNPDGWRADFSWGRVTGKARCSSTSGTTCTNDSTGASCTTNANPTTTDTTPNNGVINVGSTDKYCWCTMTGFAGAPVSSWAWVHRIGPFDDCKSRCAWACSYAVYNFPGFRRAVFGVN